MSRATWVRDTLIAAGCSVEHADRAMAEVKAEHFGQAADMAEGLRQFEKVSGPRWSAQVSENVGILRVADQLRAEARLLTSAAVPVPDETAGDETGEAYPGELAHLRDLLRGVGRLADKQPEGNPLTELLIDHYSDSRMVDAELAKSEPFPQPTRGRARIDAKTAADAEATHWRRLGITPEGGAS